MSILVDQSNRSDGYHFGDGPLEQSAAPIGGGSIGFSLKLISALFLLGSIAWIVARTMTGDR